MITTTVSKRAIIRDPEASIGQPARCWINCGCGKQVDMTLISPKTCECGTRYDTAGWIIRV